MKFFGEKLNSEMFQYENSANYLGTSIIKAFDSDDKIYNDKEFELLGWQYNHAVTFRTKLTGVVLMFWNKEEKEEVWFHVSEDFQDTLYNKYDLRKERQK